MMIALWVVQGLTVLLLLAAALLCLARMVLGPTGLDRSVASDVLIAILTAAVGLHTVATGDQHGLPILVVLSVLGFTAAVSMARLIANRSDQISTGRHRRRDDPEADDGDDDWEDAPADEFGATEADHVHANVEEGRAP